MSDKLAEEYKHFRQVVETVVESDAQRYGLIDAARDLALAAIDEVGRDTMIKKDERGREFVYLKELQAHFADARQHIERVCK